MTTVEATSEVFWTAFRSLPKKQRGAVIEKLLKDKEFMEDLVDIVIIEQRRREPSRSLDEYLTDRKKRRNYARYALGWCSL
jgi:hypothetical protein